MSVAETAAQSPLVTPAWLAERLESGNVLALDCRVERVPAPIGPSTYRERRDLWRAGRIPGAAYMHFVDDLCAPEASVPFTLASPDHVARALGAVGATERMTLVVYGQAGDISAHRVWWALTTSGHPDVRVLDGGLDRWTAEGHSLETGTPPAVAAAACTLPGRVTPVAERSDVLTAIDDPTVCLANALGREFFLGEGAQVFGRRGRIPGSVSIPVADLLDPETGCFHSTDDLKQLFADRIPSGATSIIPYCGGGVAACSLALALRVAGWSDVRVYDGSLLEWTTDPDAPMAVG